MQGVRLVRTPAMNRIPIASSGLEDNWVEIDEKSIAVKLVTPAATMTRGTDADETKLTRD